MPAGNVGLAVRRRLTTRVDLRDLEYLVALADHRHFGRAAAACFVSQPTPSTQVKELEVELGVELVERSPRDVVLTPAGEQVVDRARRIPRDAERTRGIARAAADPEAGSVRLKPFPTLAPHLLQPARRLRPDPPQREIAVLWRRSSPPYRDFLPHLADLFRPDVLP